MSGTQDRALPIDAVAPAVPLEKLVEVARRALPEYLERLAELVAVDSGSGDVEGVDRVARLVGGWLAEDGFAVDLRPAATPDGRDMGSVVVARRGSARAGASRVLLAGHLDTVFGRGEAQRRPMRVDGGRATGPGVSDDKGGLLSGVTAARVLREVGLDGEIVVVLVPDEEVGSLAGGPVLLEVAQDVDVALCLECARADGSVVSARKGASDAVLTITGRAAHAGIEPEAGVSAAVAAAHLALALQSLNDPDAGVTVNVGTVRAGSRPNVVADAAEIVADVRAADVVAFERALAAVQGLAGREPETGASVDVRLEAVVPPMERTAATAALAATYRALASGLGLDVDDVATGGVADANLLAGAGIPVLDGLGPVGGDDHAPTEWLDVDSVPERVALLAALVSVLWSPAS